MLGVIEPSWRCPMPHLPLVRLWSGVSYGLRPLSVLFTIQQSTGSFATAGGVVAAFGLTSILLPLKSRLVDRHGQASVLAPMALLCAGALATMAFLASSDSAPRACNSRKAGSAPTRRRAAFTQI